jgi:hypothetical protein
VSPRAITEGGAGQAFALARYFLDERFPELVAFLHFQVMTSSSHLTASHLISSHHHHHHGIASHLMSSHTALSDYNDGEVQ